MKTVLGVMVLALAVLAAPAQAQQKGDESPGVRSAKSYCEREAQRRGYNVVYTGNFQQYRDGWSLDMRVRDYRGREQSGSCFVETRTGDVSLYGFGWGSGDDGGGGNIQFSCASIDQRYRECQLPVDGRARLVKRNSESPCNEGSSWGQRGDRVWVDRGCRARFEVVPGGWGGGHGRIECRSQAGRYTECAFDRGYTARLERDYSGGRCVSGNWGTRDGVVWVRNGCQGRFQLERNGGGWGGGNPGQQQRAEVQCRNEAQRRGVNVRETGSARWRNGYWETWIDGWYRGREIRANCRYFPDGNRAELDIRD